MKIEIPWFSNFFRFVLKEYLLAINYQQGCFSALYSKKCENVANDKYSVFFAVDLIGKNPDLQEKHAFYCRQIIIIIIIMIIS